MQEESRGTFAPSLKAAISPFAFSALTEYCAAIPPARLWRKGFGKARGGTGPVVAGKGAPGWRPAVGVHRGPGPGFCPFGALLRI